MSAQILDPQSYPVRVRRARDAWYAAMAARDAVSKALGAAKAHRRAHEEAAEAVDEAREVYLREARTLGPDEWTP